MSGFIIFLIVLSALVLVHEAGHFFSAKFFGIRVDEFGLGLPPRAKTLFRWLDTDFTLNWLPFGGFVKIFGENPEDVEGAETKLPLAKSSDSQARGQTLLDEVSSPVSSDSFQAKSRGAQAVVLSAGVVGNIIFAWLLLSVGFMIGLPAPTALDLPVEEARTVITAVLPESPAYEAGLKSGDAIVSVSRGEFILTDATPEEVSDFISDSPEEVMFQIDRGGELLDIEVVPTNGLLDERVAVGVSMDTVGTVQLGAIRAVWEGLKTTISLTYIVAGAFVTLIVQAFGGGAELATLTGPVGLVGIVGDVSRLGLAHLLSFTAVISINLAIINLLPFPALDGGRLLFVAIESIRRRPISPRLVNTVNTVGFSILILLMVLITIQDIGRII